MRQDLLNHINGSILKRAAKLRYTVKSEAPSNEVELFNSPSLVIWSGASDNTIFQDASVNWAFRALHDSLHLSSGFDFSPQAEIELGRIQANQYEGILADIVYCEVSLQAKYYLKHGIFVQDQVLFTKEHVRGL